MLTRMSVEHSTAEDETRTQRRTRAVRHRRGPNPPMRRRQGTQCSTLVTSRDEQKVKVERCHRLWWTRDTAHGAPAWRETNPRARLRPSSVEAWWLWTLLPCHLWPRVARPAPPTVRRSMTLPDLLYREVAERGGVCLGGGDCAPPPEAACPACGCAPLALPPPGAGPWCTMLSTAG